MPARGERAYVSNEDGNSVSVIDTRLEQVIATIDVGKRPRGMKVDRAGARLFVAVSGLPKCPPTVPDEECAKRKRDLGRRRYRDRRYRIRTRSYACSRPARIPSSST